MEQTLIHHRDVSFKRTIRRLLSFMRHFGQTLREAFTRHHDEALHPSTCYDYE